MSMEAPIPSQAVPQQSEKRIPTLYIVLGVVGALIILGLLIWFVLWAAQNHPTEVEAIRDIFIIALALQSCLFGVILVIMLMMIVRLVNMLEFEIKPILEKTNETVGTVRGTTSFVSKNVVTPVTKASSYVAGVKRGMKVLFGKAEDNLPD